MDLIVFSNRSMRGKKKREKIPLSFSHTPTITDTLANIVFISKLIGTKEYFTDKNKKLTFFSIEDLSKKKLETEEWMEINHDAVLVISDSSVSAEKK